MGAIPISAGITEPLTPCSFFPSVQTQTPPPLQTDDVRSSQTAAMSKETTRKESLPRLLLHEVGRVSISRAGTQPKGKTSDGELQMFASFTAGGKCKYSQSTALLWKRDESNGVKALGRRQRGFFSCFSSTSINAQLRHIGSTDRLIFIR